MSVAPLKILFLCNRVPWPLTDGGNIASYHLMNELIMKGHHVHCLALNTNKHFVAKSDFPFNQMEGVEIDTSVSLFGAARTFFNPLPYNVYRFKSSFYSERLQSLLQENNYDLVQLEGAYIGLYISTIRKYSTAKIILRAHNVENRIWARLAKNKYSGILALYAKRMVKKIEHFETELLTSIDAVLSLTEVDATWFAARTNKPIMAIPAGIKSEAFEPQLAEVSNSFCFIGSLEWEPNIQGLKWFASEIWPSVYQQNPNLRFHIAGKNPSVALIRELEKPGIIVHGFVQSAKEFCQAHGSFLVPLRSGSGMRLKIIEAMNWSKAIVSTTVGCEGIPVNDGKELLIADTEAEWIQTLLRLTSDYPQQLQLAKNAHQFVQANYDWAALSSRHEEFYNSVL